MQTEGRQIRTMVVDDSEIAVRSICSMLERSPDIEVVGTAANGRDALTLAHTLHPELVLLDVQMPVMNGIEAVTEMKRDLRETRVIMVTVHDTQELREICRDSGADGFIPKDHLNEEFRVVLEQLFGP